MVNPKEVKKIIRSKYIWLILFTAILASAGVSQSSVNLPQQVYGEITDFDGTSVSNINVSYWSNNTTIETWALTNQDGFYDLQLSGLSSGKEVYIFVNGSNTSKYVNFSAGSSERLDHAGNYIKNTQDDTNNNDNTGSGGSSGGGGFSGGGGSNPPTDDEENSSLSKPKIISTEFSGNKTTVSVGQLSDGQQVSVRVDNTEKYLDGVTFVAGESAENTSVVLEVSQEKPGDVGKFDGGQVFRFYSVEINGLDSFSNGVIAYSVPKSWILARNSTQSSVILESYGGNTWNRLQSSPVAETLDVYSYETGFSSQGFFATGIEQKKVEQPNIKISDVNLESKGKQEIRVNITGTVKNTGSASGQKTVYLYRNSDIIDDRTVNLEPGEIKQVKFEDTVSKSGVYTYGLGDFREEVEVTSSSTKILLIIGGTVLLLITGLVALIYIRESRRARELDEKVQNIRNPQRDNTSRLKQLQKELNEMQKDLRKK